jgi:putative membrane protein
MNEVLAGSVSGCVATVPMTWAMAAMHRQLPRRERYPLPPRQVTMRVAEEAGVKEELDEGERLGLALLAHFGMGTTMGALYGPLRGHIPLPTPLGGAAFGLAVWAGNYLGLLPALGLLRPAYEHPPRRTGLMIAAHVVWGMAADVVIGCLQPRR